MSSQPCMQAQAIAESVHGCLLKARQAWPLLLQTVPMGPWCYFQKMLSVLTALHVVLQMDANVPGYQAPLPADQVKPLQEGPGPSAPRGGTGNGTGRGRGPGRGRRGRWALLIQLLSLMHPVVLGCC